MVDINNVFKAFGMQQRKAKAVQSGFNTFGSPQGFRQLRLSREQMAANLVANTLPSVFQSGDPELLQRARDIQSRTREILSRPLPPELGDDANIQDAVEAARNRPLLTLPDVLRENPNRLTEAGIDRLIAEAFETERLKELLDTPANTRLGLPTFGSIRDPVTGEIVDKRELRNKIIPSRVSFDAIQKDLDKVDYGFFIGGAVGEDLLSRTPGRIDDSLATRAHIFSEGVSNWFYNNSAQSYVTGPIARLFATSLITANDDVIIEGMADIADRLGLNPAVWGDQIRDGKIGTISKDSSISGSDFIDWSAKELLGFNRGGDFSHIGQIGTFESRVQNEGIGHVALDAAFGLIDVTPAAVYGAGLRRIPGLGRLRAQQGSVALPGGQPRRTQRLGRVGGGVAGDQEGFNLLLTPRNIADEGFRQRRQDALNVLAKSEDTIDIRRRLTVGGIARIVEPHRINLMAREIAEMNDSFEIAKYIGNVIEERAFALKPSQLDRNKRYQEDIGNLTGNDKAIEDTIGHPLYDSLILNKFKFKALREAKVPIALRPMVSSIGDRYKSRAEFVGQVEQDGVDNVIGFFNQAHLYANSRSRPYYIRAANREDERAALSARVTEKLISAPKGVKESIEQMQRNLSDASSGDAAKRIRARFIDIQSGYAKIEDVLNKEYAIDVSTTETGTKIRNLIRTQQNKLVEKSRQLNKVGSSIISEAEKQDLIKFADSQKRAFARLEKIINETIGTHDAISDDLAKALKNQKEFIRKANLFTPNIIGRTLDDIREEQKNFIEIMRGRILASRVERAEFREALRRQKRAREIIKKHAKNLEAEDLEKAKFDYEERLPAIINDIHTRVIESEELLQGNLGFTSTKLRALYDDIERIQRLTRERDDALRVARQGDEDLQRSFEIEWLNLGDDDTARLNALWDMVEEVSKLDAVFPDPVGVGGAGKNIYLKNKRVKQLFDNLGEAGGGGNLARKHLTERHQNRLIGQADAMYHAMRDLGLDVLPDQMYPYIRAKTLQSIIPAELEDSRRFFESEVNDLVKARNNFNRNSANQAGEAAGTTARTADDVPEALTPETAFKDIEGDISSDTLVRQDVARKPGSIFMEEDLSQSQFRVIDENTLQGIPGVATKADAERVTNEIADAIKALGVREVNIETGEVGLRTTYVDSDGVEGFVNTSFPTLGNITNDTLKNTGIILDFDRRASGVRRTFEMYSLIKNVLGEADPLSYIRRAEASGRVAQKFDPDKGLNINQIGSLLRNDIADVIANSKRVAAKRRAEEVRQAAIRKEEEVRQAARQERTISGDEMREDFNRYLIARRTPVYNEAQSNVRAAGQTNDDAQRVIDELDEKYGAGFFDETATKLYEFNRETLQIKRDAGLISEDDYINTLRSADNYVPFKREIDENVEFLGSQFGSRLRQVREAGGSERNIIDPFSASEQDRIIAIMAREANEVGTRFQNLVDTGVMDDVVEVVAEKGDDTYSFLVNGRQRHYRITDPFLQRAFESMIPNEVNGIMGILGSLTKIMAITYTSGSYNFVVKNPIKDYIDMFTSIAADLGYRQATKSFLSSLPIVGSSWRASLPEGLARYVASEEQVAQAKAFRAGGGQIGGAINAIAREGSAITSPYVDSLLKTKLQGNLASRNFRKTAGILNNAFFGAAGFTENVNRLTAHIAALKTGATEDQAREVAHFATVNFLERGAGFGKRKVPEKLRWIGADTIDTTGLSGLSAFLNAHVQGLNRLKKTSLSLKGFTTFMGLGLAFALLEYKNNNNISPRTSGGVAGELNWYDEIGLSQPYQLKRYFTFFYNDDEAIRMPMSYNAIPYMQAARTIVRAIHGDIDDKETLDGFKDIFSLSTELINPFGEGTTLHKASPTITDPFISNLLNKDWHGGQVSPDNVGRLSPSEDTVFDNQEANNSTEWIISKRIAELTNGIGLFDAEVLNTAGKVNVFLNSYGGGVVDTAAGLVDSVRQLAGEEIIDRDNIKRNPALLDDIVIRSFTYKRPTQISIERSALKKIYDDKVFPITAKLRDAQDSGDIDTVLELTDELIDIRLDFDKYEVGENEVNPGGFISLLLKNDNADYVSGIFTRNPETMRAPNYVYSNDGKILSVPSILEYYIYLKLAGYTNSFTTTKKKAKELYEKGISIMNETNGVNTAPSI